MIDLSGMQRIDDGTAIRLRVKETETHYIEIVQMLFNFRITETLKLNPNTYDRGWCYQGLDEDAFTIVVLAAIAWDGSKDTEPAGYFKKV